MRLLLWILSYPLKSPFFAPIFPYNFLFGLPKSFFTGWERMEVTSFLLKNTRNNRAIKLLLKRGFGEFLKIYNGDSMGRIREKIALGLFYPSLTPLVHGSLS